MNAFNLASTPSRMHVCFSILRCKVLSSLDVLGQVWQAGIEQFLFLGGDLADFVDFGNTFRAELNVGGKVRDTLVGVEWGEDVGRFL